MHNVQDNQEYRIMTIEIAVAADADKAAVSDEISALLSENGVVNPDSTIQDWQYAGEERLVQTGDSPEEGEVFRRDEAAKTDRQLLGIVIEGGLIQSVVTEHPEICKDLDIIQIDYDTEGADPEDLFEVPQDKAGRTETAFISEHAVEQENIRLREVYEDFQAKEDTRPGPR